MMSKMGDGEPLYIKYIFFWNYRKFLKFFLDGKSPDIQDNFNKKLIWKSIFLNRYINMKIYLLIISIYLSSESI